MVRFQKLIKKKVFLIYTDIAYIAISGNLSKFLMHYQQFGSHAYYGAAGPVYNMAA
jgi:hypothetical protein